MVDNKNNAPPPNQAGSTTGNTQTRDDELKRLRSILFGDDGQHLKKSIELHGRAIVSDVISEAILDRQKKDASFKAVIMPLVEDSVERSVSNHGEKLTTILYPLVGRLVRKSVSAFLAQFIEKTNEIIESAVSIKGLLWRYKAWQSGVPFSQYLAAQTYEYRVEQVLLIHRKSGLLIKSVALNPAADEDADLISSMLTAINDFVSDSFKSQTHEQKLDEVKTDDFSMLISHGPDAVLVAAVSGSVPYDVRQIFSETLESLHSLYASELAEYQGDSVPFESTDPILRECLVTQIKPELNSNKKKPWFGYLFLLGLSVLAIWFAVIAYENIQLRNKIETLNDVPGIVVTKIEQDGDAFSLSVLRDSAGMPLNEWFAANNINPNKINLTQRAFISLEPTIVNNKLLSLVEKTKGVQLTDAQQPTLTGQLGWQEMQEFNRQLAAIPGIDLLTIKRDELLLLDISLQAEQQPAIQRQLFEQLVGEIARIQISFDVNDTNLNATAFQNIDVLTSLLRSTFALASKLNLTANLIIIGASDATGVSSVNERLSLARANSVKTALINQGIELDKLFSAGIGEVALSSDSVATRRVMFNVMYTQLEENAVGAQ